MVESSEYLKKVRYEIRGKVTERAKELALEGHNIIPLNIGNPANFGFSSPDPINIAIIQNLKKSCGYSDSKGIFSAREAIVVNSQELGIKNVKLEHVFIGNGVSELIMISMLALLNPNDEVLLPSPNYPLWSAAVASARGKTVFYPCIPENQWEPDIEKLESLISSRTRALVIINPNNPTGAVYSKKTLLALLNVARKNKLTIFTDEIYSKIIYDDCAFIPLASLCDDVLIITMNGLSKNYRSCGFRVGWMFFSGLTHLAKDYIRGVNTLMSMRLCSNVPGQWAIQTALGGYQSIEDLCDSRGRLYKQRELFCEKLSSIEGLNLVVPKGTIYIFPYYDKKQFSFKDDEDLVLKLLEEEFILTVQGSGLDHWDNNAFRIVFLPYPQQIGEIAVKMERFFNRHHA